VALCSDGMPDDVQYGFSVDESHTSNVAIRIANLLECDAVVIDDTTGRITQTIRYRPGTAPLGRTKTPAPNKERITREYLSGVSIVDEPAYRFIQQYINAGYAVAITPMTSRLRKVPYYMVNIVASKYNGEHTL